MALAYDICKQCIPDLPAPPDCLFELQQWASNMPRGLLFADTLTIGMQSAIVIASLQMISPISSFAMVYGTPKGDADEPFLPTVQLSDRPLQIFGLKSDRGLQFLPHAFFTVTNVVYTGEGFRCVEPCYLLPWAHDLPVNFRVAEIFAGGLGGWSMALNLLTQQASTSNSFAHTFAVEHDSELAFDFACNHGANIIRSVHDATDDQFSVFVGDASAWHVIGLTSETRTNVLCASPPCQPYSSAGKGRGLFAQEAWPFVEWIWSLRLLQLPLALLENVGGLIRHRHWSIFSALIHQSGYDINITQLSPLSKCRPIHRTRFLAVLVNKRLGITDPVTPPLLPSLPLDTTLLRSVINYSWPESHLAELQLTEEQVCFYDRQDLLPAEWSGCGEYVIEARIMHTSEHARTALASYGRAHDFGESCLAEGKLLGRLLRTPKGFRFISPLEHQLLHGTVSETFVSRDLRRAQQSVGNHLPAIQAASILIAAFQVVGVQYQQDPLDLLSQMCSAFVHPRMMSLEVTEDHWVLRASDDTILSVLRAHGISALDWVIFDNGRINRTHRMSPFSTWGGIAGELLFFQECLAFQEGDRSDNVLKQLKEYVQGLWCKLAVPSCKRMILSFPFLGYFEVAVPEAATEVKVYEAFHKAVRTDCEFWKYQAAMQLSMSGPVTALPLVHWLLQPFRTVQGFICAVNDRNTHDTAVQLIFQIRLLAQLESRELYLMRIQPNPVGTDDRLVLMSRVFRPANVISTMFQDAVCSAYFNFLIQPFCDDSQQGIRLRIRLWTGVIFAGYVRRDTPLNLVHEAWAYACSWLAEVDGPIRTILNGRSAMPGTLLSDHISPDARHATIHILRPLHGGGTVVPDGVSVDAADELIPQQSPPDSSHTPLIQETWCTCKPVHRRPVNILSMTANCEWKQAGLGTLSAVLPLDDGIRLIGEWDQTGVLTHFELLGWTFQCLRQYSTLHLRIVDQADSSVPATVIALTDLLFAQYVCTFEIAAGLTAGSLITSVDLKVKTITGLTLFARVPAGTKAVVLHRAWMFAAAWTGVSNVIRLVTGGRQIMPSIAFRSQPKGSTSAVHVVFPLHGGGGSTEPTDDLVSLLTRTMCLQGAEQEESQAFAQKIVAQLGAARIRRVCTDTRPEHIGKGLRGLASAASVKLPSMQLAVQRSSGSKAVKRLTVPHQATHFTLVPGFAKTQEGTAATIIHDMAEHCGPAVILLDAEAAAPWLQEPQTPTRLDGSWYSVQVCSSRRVYHHAYPGT